MRYDHPSELLDVDEHGDVLVVRVRHSNLLDDSRAPSSARSET